MQKRKKLFLLLVCFFVFAPHISFAAIDSRCWTQEKCIKQRKAQDTFGNMTNADLEDGFIRTFEAKKACKKDITGAEMGFCLPNNTTKTEISFGGKKKFLHLGEFIQTLYRYGIVAAGVLAVIMIIVAGFTWTTSGGNSERIGSAKKRIAGSVTGLTLAVLSYTLLNTLNPAMVDLRLPQIWMINTDNVVSAKYCIELGPDKKIAKKTQKSEPNSSYKLPYVTLPAKNAILPKKDGTVNDSKHIAAACNQTYAIMDSSDTCLGNICPSKQFCFDGEGCKQIAPGLLGNIEYEGDKYVDDIWLYALCEDDSIKQVDSIDVGSGELQYKITDDIAKKGASECNNKIKGYFMTIEVNDDDLLNTSDDQWVGGKSFCSNLNNSPSCGVMGETTVNQGDAAEHTQFMWSHDQLFSQAEMENGYLCNLSITEKHMPNVGTAFLTDAVAGVFTYFAESFPGGEEAVLSFIGGENKYYANINVECPSLKSKEKEFQENLYKIMQKRKN